MDQASTLRAMTRPAAGRNVQIYSITSGKGGVGKTSLTINIATRLGQIGKRVLLIDADMGLANVDIMFGLSPENTIEQLFSGECGLEELLLQGPENVTVLPAASGVQSMTHLNNEQIMLFMGAIDELEQDFDVLLVDTGAGIGRNVLHFNAAAQDVLLVVNQEPTSLTDAYAMTKLLARDYSVKRVQLIVNSVPDRKAAVQVYKRLTRVADQYLQHLGVGIEFLGYVLKDEAVPRSVIDRRPLMLSNPDSPAASCIRDVVDTLMRDADARPPSGNMQFFWKRLLQGQPAASTGG
jgi:flagellar biosynthesis protein FlhG